MSFRTAAVLLILSTFTAGLALAAFAQPSNALQADEPGQVQVPCVEPNFTETTTGMCFLLQEGLDNGCLVIDNTPFCAIPDCSGAYNLAIVDDTCEPPAPLDLPFQQTSGPVTIGSASSVPVVWELTTLSVEACAGGAATYAVVDSSGVTELSGAMVESSDGIYEASFAGLAGAGTYTIETTVTCPDTTLEEHTATITYYDPSGQVRACTGTPIVGATVTLTRSDTLAGPYTPVPDGSDLMSPDNRMNPMSTDGNGLYGWDVADGFYVVVVDAGVYGVQQSPPLQVPPPRFNVNFDFPCVVEDASPDAVRFHTSAAPPETEADATPPAVSNAVAPNPQVQVAESPLAVTGGETDGWPLGLMMIALGSAALGTARHRRRFASGS